MLSLPQALFELRLKFFPILSAVKLIVCDLLSVTYLAFVEASL